MRVVSVRFGLLRQALVSSAIASALVLGLTSPAQAEEASPTGKGITGGALLGAEVVMLTEAALKVKPAWAYIVGGVVGAAGGGVGGYFLEQEGDAKLSLYALAGGFALVIPTTVAVLSATAYEPPRDYTQDRAPADEPVAEPPRSAEPASEPASEPAAEPPPPAEAPKPESQVTPPPPARGSAAPALVALSSGTLYLSVPAVEVRNVFSRRELAMYGVEQQTEVRLPVFTARF
jgi:hypothetical protein